VPVPPQSAGAFCQPAVGRGRQGGIRPCPLDPWPLAYADCREGPELRAALHRPGATRHPWRDAPSPGHPDRSPVPFIPPLGPADSFGLGRSRTIVHSLQPLAKSGTGLRVCVGSVIIARNYRTGSCFSCFFFCIKSCSLIGMDSLVAIQFLSSWLT